MIGWACSGCPRNKSPYAIVLLPSHQDWEREAGLCWGEESGRREGRKKKCLIGSARRRPFAADCTCRLLQAQEAGPWVVSWFVVISGVGIHPRRLALEYRNLAALLRELRNELKSAGAGADDGHALASEVYARVPFRRVHPRPLEEGPSRELRIRGRFIGPIARTRA